MPADEASGTEVYSDFIEAELAAQRSSTTSLEQRAIAVITTSGVLVTLLFGLAAVVSKGKNFHLPGGAKPFLFASLAGFVTAAVLALIAVRPRRYRSPTGAGLGRVIRDKWKDRATVARRRVAVTRLELLESHKNANESKGRFLVRAVEAEIAAVGLLAIAVAIILWSGA